MNATVQIREELANHARLIRERFLADPIGLLMVGIGVVLLGYGEVNMIYSPLRIGVLEAWVGGAFGGIEVLSIVLLLIAAARRVITGDFYVTPSAITWPMILIGFVLFLVPWVRMVATGGGLRIPFEATFIPFMVLSFFAWRLVFHPSDVRLMAWMIIGALLYKCVEGLLIFGVNDRVWGALTGWRDGMLIALGVSGALLAYVIRPAGEEWYARIRRVLLLTAPIVLIVFILSMRRSYMLSLVVALPFLFYFLRGRERRTFLRAMVLASPIVLVGALAFGLEGVGMRLGSIAAPTEEGSAAWRLLEFFNVISMIGQRPIFGWPLGVEFINVTGIDLPEINTLMPHNSYLYALLRAGVIGLLFWFWFLRRMIGMALGTIHAAPTPGYRFLSLWMYSMTIFIIVSGLTSPVFASRLTILLPFCLVLMSMLPGAFYHRPVNRTQAEKAGV